MEGERERVRGRVGRALLRLHDAPPLVHLPETETFFCVCVLLSAVLEPLGTHPALSDYPPLFPLYEIHLSDGSPRIFVINYTWVIWDDD